MDPLELLAQCENESRGTKRSHTDQKQELSFNLSAKTIGLLNRCGVPWTKIRNSCKTKDDLQDVIDKGLAFRAAFHNHNNGEDPCQGDMFFFLSKMGKKLDKMTFTASQGDLMWRCETGPLEMRGSRNDKSISFYQMKSFFFDFNIPVDKVREKTREEAGTLLKLMRNKALPNDNAPYKKHGSNSSRDTSAMSKEAIYNFFADDEDDTSMPLSSPPLSQRSSHTSFARDLSLNSSLSSQPCFAPDPTLVENNSTFNNTTARQLFAPPPPSVSPNSQAPVSLPYNQNSGQYAEQSPLSSSSTLTFSPPQHLNINQSFLPLSDSSHSLPVSTSTHPSSIQPNSTTLIQNDSISTTTHAPSSSALKAARKITGKPPVVTN